MSPGFEQRVEEMKFEDVKRCLMILEASNFYPPEEPKKGRKKVKVRLTEEYIDNMEQHPLPALQTSPLQQSAGPGG